MEEIEFVLIFSSEEKNSPKFLYSEEVFYLLVNNTFDFKERTLDELIEMWKEQNQGKEHLIKKMIGIPYDNE